ncbi:MAG: cysteinyl-tRNA synthetase, partial [Vicinamibacterales bacterium]
GKQGRRVHEFLLDNLPRPPKVAIVEAPAGFQPNVDHVTGKLRAFFEHNLQNYRPVVKPVLARSRGGPYDADDPETVRPLYAADLIVAGPGSPTYAARVLAGSRTLRVIEARLVEGVTISLASAAAIAFGRYALPVYEIFKAGDDLHWAAGLDLFATVGLNLTVIPHWNNREGGSDLDTSRCYMGTERFERLLAILPGPTTILGIDEHTACVIDSDGGTASVHGAGTVCILRDGHERTFASGERFALDLLLRRDPVQ